MSEKMINVGKKSATFQIIFLCMKLDGVKPQFHVYQ